MARPKKTAPAAEKKPRGRAAGGGSKKTEAATVTEAIKMIPAKKLAALMASGRKSYQETRSISGEFGAEVKEAAENDHLHKKAFAVTRSLDRMEPEKLTDFFAHFDYYCDSTGLRKRAGSVMRMPLNDGPGETAAAASDFEEGDPADRTGSVLPFAGNGSRPH